MPETPIYGLPFEAPTDKPGITITGVDLSAVLAEAVEAVLQSLDARIAGLETNGYRYLSSVTYTASGTFTPASYPGLRAVRVKVIGGGGQCGGAGATTAGQASEGGGGGGGGYAESFLLAASLPSSVTVTIGAGGSAAAAGVAGEAGGTSAFGALLSATGGGGGNAGTGTSGFAGADGGIAGEGSGGNIINIPGVEGFNGVVLNGENAKQNMGGWSHFGGTANSLAASSNGVTGRPYGGGGGGTRNGVNQTARAGAPGTSGVILVDVYV